MKSTLDAIAADLPSLRAVLITAMPDCLLFESWQREDVTLSPDKAAAYFGDLIRANHAGLKSLGALSAQMQVTVETDDHLIMIREIRDNFVVTAVFDVGSPLGMVRLFLEQVLQVADDKLPRLVTQARPKGVKLVEFLRKYAPDPHAVLKRASLRSGIPLSKLRSAADLTDEQVVKLEAVTKDILQLDHIAV